MLDLLLINGLSLIVHMSLWFIDSAIHKNFGYVDIGWGLNFVIVVWVSFYLTSNTSILSYLILCLVTLWGLRLSYHLWLRNRNKAEDFRYQTMRKNFGKHPENPHIRMYV